MKIHEIGLKMTHDMTLYIYIYMNVESCGIQWVRIRPNMNM